MPGTHRKRDTPTLALPHLHRAVITNWPNWKQNLIINNASILYGQSAKRQSETDAEARSIAGALINEPTINWILNQFAHKPILIMFCKNWMPINQFIMAAKVLTPVHSLTYTHTHTRHIYLNPQLTCYMPPDRASTSCCSLSCHKFGAKIQTQPRFFSRSRAEQMYEQCRRKMCGILYLYTL